jgi:hypothetical protein
MISVGDKFIWWFGVVEDRNDPLKLGRVRVRCYNYHTEDKGQIPTNTLHWAQPMQSITSGAMGDIGTTPTGIVEGTWVIGFFADGKEYQRPIVMGTLAGIPVNLPNTKEGFNDPNGTYPSRIEEPDVNRLARNDTAHPVLASKEDGRTKNVSIANSNDTWNEQESKYNASYPKNHVMETESGHIKEYDDTENNTRIHEYHRAGTFYEIDNNGNKVTRIVGDNYQVVAGANYVNIKGDVNLTIDSNCNTHIKKDWNIQVDGNVKEVIKGTYDQDVTGAITVDGSTINLNNGTKGAARLDDTVDTGDDPAGISGSDGSNRIETSSKTVIIGD